MARLIRCDACNVERPSSAFGWLRVTDGSDAYVQVVGERRVVGDYCSARCLADAALRAAAAQVGV